MTWLLCDYGGVLSLPQSPDDLDRLSHLTGLEPNALESRYWATRPAYDRGDLSAAEYWATVIDPPGDKDRLDALVEADVASWLHVNPQSIAAVERARSRGHHLALLSNAPVEVAREIARLPALATFEHCWFSCDLRLIKPEPEIYARVLAALGNRPADVIFVDDRADNVAAAAAAGLPSVLFERAEQFDSL